VIEAFRNDELEEKTPSPSPSPVEGEGKKKRIEREGKRVQE